MAESRPKNPCYTYTGRFVNARRQTIFCKYWEPERPKALVFIAHGYAEHCLLYERLALKLVDHNYFVVTHDHVGHGRSEGSRAQIDNFSKFVDDIFFHLALVSSRQPGLDVYICGHSMGGAIAILAALRHQDFFKGLLLIGPAVKTNPQLTTPFKIRMAKFLRCILPFFPVASLDIDLLCRSPVSRKLFREDPMRYQGLCKAGFGASLIDALKTIQENAADLMCPFIIYQGEADKICSPEGAVFLYERSQSDDKMLKIYPKAYHSLLYEPDGVPERLMSDIIDWLNAHQNI